MPGRRKTASIPKSHPHPEDLPPCDGPKLHPFPHQNSPIEWLGRIDAERDEMSGSGTEGYVFKVKIESQIYALKVFKFFNPEDTRYYWESLLDDSITPQTVAYHTDPFFAECRAYGRIKAAQRKGLLKRQLVIPCWGYLYLHDKDRRMLEDIGLDLEEDYLDDDDLSSPGQRPIRAIVKELASSDAGINTKSLRGVLRDIKLLNKLRVYNRDIRKANFRDGQLVDFGSAWTEPHCFMENSADKDEAAETRLGDLVMFDDMVSLEGFRTNVRAMPNWKYCSKLRSRSKATT